MTIAPQQLTRDEQRVAKHFDFAGLQVLDPASVLTGYGVGQVSKSATACAVSSSTFNAVLFSRRVTGWESTSELLIHLGLRLRGDIPTPVGNYRGVYVGIMNSPSAPTRWMLLGLARDSSGAYHQWTATQGAAPSISGGTITNPGELRWKVSGQSNGVFRGGPYDVFDTDGQPISGAGTGAVIPFLSGFSSVYIGMGVFDDNAEEASGIPLAGMWNVDLFPRGFAAGGL